jgi:hypothetical protein
MLIVRNFDWLSENKYLSKNWTLIFPKSILYQNLQISIKYFNETCTEFNYTSNGVKPILVILPNFGYILSCTQFLIFLFYA